MIEKFIYENNELNVIKKDDDIWFHAKTVGNILKYTILVKLLLIMWIVKIKSHMVS